MPGHHDEASWSGSQPLRLSGYVVLCEFGRGPHGRCCKVREKPHREVPPYMDDLEPCFALKCIDLAEQNMSIDGRQRAVQDMQKLLNLQHTNIVRYHRAFLYEGRLCYMTEFAECGTLHHMIHQIKEQGKRLSEGFVWHLFTQICQGLKRLHDHKVAHRAIKTRNLLLFPEELYSHRELKYRCKLTDLGIPELQRHQRLSTLSGSTLRYLAPEILSKGPTDEKVDVWALGCVLYEMVTLAHAFNATSAIQAAQYAPLPSHVPESLRDAIGSMLQLDPARRPSVADLLRRPQLVQCIFELPNPALLDSAPPPPLTPPAADPAQVLDSAPPPTKAPSAAHDGSEPGGSEAGDSLSSAATAIAHSSASSSTGGSSSTARSPFPPGTSCWAKYGADGMWYRGVVEHGIEDDACFVHFPELQMTDVCWRHTLRVASAAEAVEHIDVGLRSGGGRSHRQPDYSKGELQATPERISSSKRLVSWSEELSSQSERAYDDRRGGGAHYDDYSGGGGSGHDSHRPSESRHPSHRTSERGSFDSTNMRSSYSSVRISASDADCNSPSLRASANVSELDPSDRGDPSSGGRGAYGSPDSHARGGHRSRQGSSHSRQSSSGGLPRHSHRQSDSHGRDDLGSRKPSLHYISERPPPSSSRACVIL